MEIALQVMEITAPVFLLAALGFFWVRMGAPYPVEFVSQLAMTVAVPALIFTALMTTEIDPAALQDLLLASLAAYGVVWIVFWVLCTLGKLERRSFLAPLAFGNTGNLGLPVVLFAFGEIGLGYGVVVFAVMAILAFTVGIWSVSGTSSMQKLLREPILWASLLGVLFLAMDWETPLFLTNTLSLVGQLAIPLMLITLGVAISKLTPRSLTQALGLSVVKTALCAGIAYGVGLLFALDPVPLAVLTLQVSTPVAVTSYLLAEKYGADSGAVAGLVVVSTALSVITLPLTLAFFL